MKIGLRPRLDVGGRVEDRHGITIVDHADVAAEFGNVAADVAFPAEQIIAALLRLPFPHGSKGPFRGPFLPVEHERERFWRNIVAIFKNLDPRVRFCIGAASI